jgi:Ca2+/Na+ antiporter
MNNAAMWGWIGGLAGAVIGLVGGVVGTYFSIRNANGPRERSFMIKSAVVCWMAILIFLGLLFVLPHPYRWLMWIPYSVLLPLGIIYGNRRQQAIRQQESQNQRPETRSQRASFQA